jgi:hypothetical protein
MVASTVLAAIALAASHGMRAGWHGNQNTYLLQAAAGDGPLNADLVVRTSDPAPLFTLLVTPVVRVFDGPWGVDLLWPVVAVGFFAALCWAGGEHLVRDRRALLLWTAAVAVLINPLTRELFSHVLNRVDLTLPYPHQAIWGVANQTALSSTVEPSTGAVAAVVGCVLVVRRRVLPGFALVMVAPLLHPSFIAPALLLVVALAAAEIWGADDGARARRDLGRSGVAVAALTALWAIVNWEAIDAVRGPSADLANRILVFNRVPVHARPQVWWGVGAFVALGAVALAGVLSLRRGRHRDDRLGRFLLTGLALVCTSAVVVVLLDTPTLNLTFPWRASVVLVPIAVAWLLGRAASSVVGLLRDRTLASYVVLGAGAVLLVISVVAGLQDTISSFVTRPRDDALIQSLRADAPRGTGLIPTHLQNVRLNADLPVYVDRKTHPVEPEAVVEWWRRKREVDLAMEDPESLCELVAASSFGWVVVPSDLAGEVGSTCLASWASERIDDVTLFRRVPAPAGSARR